MARTYTEVEKHIMRTLYFFGNDGVITDEERAKMSNKFVKLDTGETIPWSEFNYKEHHGLFRCNEEGVEVDEYTGEVLEA